MKRLSSKRQRQLADEVFGRMLRFTEVYDLDGVVRQCAEEVLFDRLKVNLTVAQYDRIADHARGLLKEAWAIHGDAEWLPKNKT